MSILDLPPELLLEILSLTVSNSPSQGRLSFLEFRTHILLPLALVHRTWTPLAQEVLNREVWINARRPNQMKRKAERIVESDVKGTQNLTVQGGIEVLLSITGTERWKGVTYLENIADLAFPPTKMELFAQHFPNLRTLSLESARFTIESIPTSLSFPHLRRLTLPGSFSSSRCPCIDASLPLLQRFFSPSSFPNLIHLACDVAFCSHDFISVFSGILPQIESFSLRDVFGFTTEESYRELFGKAKRLKHLAVSWVEESNQSLSRFFRTNTTVPVILDTLHIAIALIQDDTEFGNRLIDIADGRIEICKVNEVIVHSAGLDGDQPPRINYKWRTGITPFKEFDGSYTRMWWDSIDSFERKRITRLRMDTHSKMRECSGQHLQPKKLDIFSDSPGYESSYVTNKAIDNQ